MSETNNIIQKQTIERLKYVIGEQAGTIATLETEKNILLAQIDHLNEKLEEKEKDSEEKEE